MTGEREQDYLSRANLIKLEQRERKGKSRVKKREGWCCPGRRGATLRWDSKHLGQKGRGINDSNGTCTFIFVQVLTKDVRRVLGLFLSWRHGILDPPRPPYLTPLQKLEVLDLRMKLPISREPLWVYSIFFYSAVPR